MPNIKHTLAIVAGAALPIVFAYIGSHAWTIPVHIGAAVGVVTIAAKINWGGAS